ncbi:MAG: DUF5658 family protein [Candidatus Methanoperedens sp.]|nr:DUF5658 family protein [Candidatus Methanoperedens sp.]
MKELQENCKRNEIIREDVSLAEVLRLLIKYTISRLNVQGILFLLAFLSFGAGDGISAAYMIDKRGAIVEANPFIRYMYESNGSNGVIEIKLWLVLIILYFVWNISKDRKNYWMINGFLFALFVCGLIATGANLMAAEGLDYPAPSSIIATYLFLVILLSLLGDAMDRLHL